MEGGAGSEQSLLVVELTRSHELLRQLEAHLDQPSGIDFCKSLASNILSSMEKVISMAKSSGFEGERQLACPNAGSDSSGSPRSENSDREFKERGKDMSKKRKTQPKWTKQVKVGSGEGAEGPLEDGYSWRKYGQKDILGAKYPRGYYRCTHRNNRGCPAIKQVQRCDENPSVFEVTYRGTHTCVQKPQLVSTREQELKQAQLHPQGFVQQQQQQQQDHQLLLSFQAALRVKTEGLSPKGQDVASPSSFSFPSTPVNCLNSENRAFSSPPTLENCFMSTFSPSFISPATSESNYFSVSPCRMSSYGGGPNLQTTESDFTEIISAATSATNSPMVDLDFMLDPVELERDFPFDADSFF